MGRFLLRHKSYIFLLLILLLTLKVFIPQLDELKDSLSALKDADLTWILSGIVIFFAGVPILALQFLALALKPLPFGLTYKVEMAGLFVSKLLPSALGTISLNMYYFMKKNHTASQAATVMTMNALTSGIAYGFLIIAGLLTSDLSLKGLQGSIEIPPNLIWLLIIILLGLGYLAYRSAALRSRMSAVFKAFRHNFAHYKERPLSLVYGLICNFTGSFTSLFALYASAHSLSIDLSLAGALLAYTFGNIAAAIIPTPGGLGATEAGIYSGLVLVGISGSDAIIVTLIYRLITYWLPILPGYYFFWGLRKNVLANFSFKKRYS